MVTKASKPVPTEPSIAYQDRDLLVVFKPAGWPVQPDKTGSPDLLAWARLACGDAALYLVHRLDRPVSGLVILARRPAIQTALTRQMSLPAGLAKRYLAVVCGQPPADVGTLTDYLAKNERLNRSRIATPDHPQAKLARLHYQCLQCVQTPDGQLLSLLAIDLETGRHHQIRVQLAHAGWPIWGDTKYNPDSHSRKGWQTIALLAWRLSFAHPVNGRRLDLLAPWPVSPPWTLFCQPGEPDRQ